ncbi:MAG: hypothetical protein VST71_11475 [Nitrospirota bacterium]|nr:hypothetical protein [Nitrospirota bacterium]
MKRDRFYQQIIERFKGPIDPDLFEECVADILRADFPAIVPVRGGSDAGMDGAVADGKGRPFPLVCTTNKDVIGNLTKNLNSYLSNSGTRREVILATNQELTSIKRRNLENRAEELGFTLIQVYTRTAIADRLYYNQHWCRELLNLTGEPSPISIIPRTARPLLGETLIGREEDMAWVQRSKGDRLLVGQPGSGKTFLLHLYAKQGRGFFVINKDCSVIAPAIRMQNPEALIVDDAHLHTDFLIELRQLREQIGASFEIIATCWPGAQDKVAETLNLPTSQIYRLELLTRDEIVKVIKFAGIKGPIELIREIVNQSQGRPGLAVTLVYLCVNGDVKKVALGDALSRSILATFESLVGEKASIVLAAFAIGGDSGMSMKVVAEALELPIGDLYIIVTELASAGVIYENSRLNTLSVKPVTLRFALVRDIFFKGPPSLDSEPLIEEAPDLTDVALTLVGAIARGAIIPSDQLLTILEKARSDVWKAYAWLGRNEANIVLERHPELLMKIARAALHRAPETVVPLLLKAAVGDERPLHSATDHPLRLISDWIKESYPGSGEVIERRKSLLRATRDAIAKETDIKVCLKALSFVFSLRYESHTVDPGFGRTVTFTHGAVTLDEIKSIGKLWPEVLVIIKKIDKPDWLPVIDVVNEIAFPGPLMNKPQPCFYETRKEIISQILGDLVSLPGVGLGLLHRIKGIAKRLSLELKIELDRAFEILFPWREIDNWENAQERQRKAVLKLAKEWAKESLDRVVEKIAFFEAEAKATSVKYPRWSPLLCWELAQKVKLRVPWVKAMIMGEIPGDLIEPFLRQAALNDEVGWKKAIVECLSIRSLKWVVIPILLTLPSPPTYLLNKALQNLEGFAAMIETLCLRREVPEETLIRLLCHPDPLIAGNAAIGEWQSYPKGRVHANLKDYWRKVILHLNYDEYWLGEILKNDPELAYEWWEIHIKQKRIPYEMLNIYQSAITPLGQEKRQELLKMLPKDTWWTEIVDYLIEDSLELYRVLLEDKNKKDFHLLPLRGFRNDLLGEDAWEEEAWIAKAEAALDAGYDPEDIAGAIFSYGWSYSGNISNMWKSWIERYERLCLNEDPRIRKIGEIGKTKAIKELERSLKKERREAVYGYA